MRSLLVIRLKQLGLLVFGAVLISGGGYLLLVGQVGMVKDASAASIAGAGRGDAVEQSAGEGKPDINGESKSNGRPKKLSEKYGDGWKKKYEFNLTGKPVDVDRLDEYLAERDVDKLANVGLVAAYHGDLGTVEKIIASGVVLKDGKDLGKWLIAAIGRRAMYDKKLETLKWALAKGMSPSDRARKTDPIIDAAKAGPEFVLALFEAGLDPNGTIYTGTSDQKPILAYLEEQAMSDPKRLQAFRLALDYGGRRPERFDLYARSDWDELVAKAMALDMSDVYATRGISSDKGKGQ